MPADDETAITEITIQPDGRIYVFGLSLEVAEILQILCPADPRLVQIKAETSRSPRTS